ncbi:hypothetical protein SC813_15610 [Legionella pneumophila serogroup 1]
MKRYFKDIKLIGVKYKWYIPEGDEVWLKCAREGYGNPLARYFVHLKI